MNETVNGLFKCWIIVELWIKKLWESWKKKRLNRIHKKWATGKEIWYCKKC